jgi:integrase
MGKLYKRGGTYYADYFDRQGRRRRESTRTADPVVARARLRELELATTDRAAHQTEDLDAAVKYFCDVVHAGSPADTVRCYRQKARHLSRLHGAEQLDQLTRETIERYIASRIAEGAHTHSIHKELVVLRGALASARARGLFHGPADLVPRFRAGYVPRTAYMTPEQFLDLVDGLVPPASAGARPATLERREARKRDRALHCLLIAFASPRLGELEALRWEHVDLARGVIRVPKGKTIGRTIAIHEVLRPWLEALHADVGPVVAPWSNMTRDLSRAAARAGLHVRVDARGDPHISANDLRRTFASWLVQAGVSLLVVSRLLGHKSTRMVDMVYGQLDDATLARAIERLPGGCDAGVPREVPTRGTPGAGGTSAAPLSIVNSVEESAHSHGSEVPRVGIEPTTRGFSVLKELAPEPKNNRRLLRLVR